MARRRSRQIELEFHPWGGAREGSGRKRGRPRPGVPHRPRPELAGRFPVHVTLRMRDQVWNLRSRRAFRVIAAALRGVNQAACLRVIHFSVQGNHLHLLVEAASGYELARGMKSLGVRLARGLNRLMGRSGPAFDDHYHAHILRTPAEVRHALEYLLGNFASHARRRGEEVQADWADPYSSSCGAALSQGLVLSARSWLLRSAILKGETSAPARRAGSGSLDEPSPSLAVPFASEAAVGWSAAA